MTLFHGRVEVNDISQAKQTTQVFGDKVSYGRTRIGVEQAEELCNQRFLYVFEVFARGFFQVVAQVGEPLVEVEAPLFIYVRQSLVDGLVEKKTWSGCEVDTHCKRLTSEIAEVYFVIWKCVKFF